MYSVTHASRGEFQAFKVLCPTRHLLIQQNADLFAVYSVYSAGGLEIEDPMADKSLPL